LCASRTGSFASKAEIDQAVAARYKDQSLIANAMVSTLRTGMAKR
jgi:hypothetical protein